MKSKRKVFGWSSSIVFVVCGVALAGCGVAEGEGDIEQRRFVFDGSDVQAQIDEDPSASFVVDLRDGDVFEFDQTSEDIDFSRFSVQCPTMRAPVPMEGFAQAMQVPTEAPWFSIRSTDPEVEPRAGGSDCITVCNAEQDDCVQLCV